MTFSEFLEALASKMGYDPDQLEFRAERRSGGPTVHPGAARESQIVKKWSNVCIDRPSGHYDDLDTHHLQFSIVLVRPMEDGSAMETPIYSWQHHPFPGCCRYAVNRWVRAHIQLPDDIVCSALEMRKWYANLYGAKQLFITTGPSGSLNGEHLDAFTEILNDESTRTKLYSIDTVQA